MTERRYICTVCGFEMEATMAVCPHCGCDLSKTPAREMIVSRKVLGVNFRGPNGLVLRTPPGDSYVVSRHVCLGMFGAAANVISSKGQFEVYRESDEKWGIRPCAGASNPTQRNGLPLTGDIELTSGDTIAIGDLNLDVELRLG